MELSRAADYAVRAVLELAGSGAESPFSTAEVARRQGIPRPMLAKIVPRLAQHGLVVSRRGSRGGLFLGRSPEDISLLEVVEAIEGRIVLNRCVRSPAECPLSASCAVHEQWKGAQVLLRGFLQSVTIANLTRRRAQLRVRKPDLNGAEPGDK